MSQCIIYAAAWLFVSTATPPVAFPSIEACQQAVANLKGIRGVCVDGGGK